MTKTAAIIYKAVSDLICDSYEWLMDEKQKDKAVQYVLGINDMARYLIETLDREEEIE